MLDALRLGSREGLNRVDTYKGSLQSTTLHWEPCEACDFADTKAKTKSETVLFHAIKKLRKQKKSGKYVELNLTEPKLLIRSNWYVAIQRCMQAYVDIEKSL